MTTRSRRPKGRDTVLSTLNVAIDDLSLAKEHSRIAPARAIFGSVSILLAVIKDTMVNKLDYVEVGLLCADICRLLYRGVNGKKPDDLSQPVYDVINQLVVIVAEIQKKVNKQSGRHTVSRFLHARNEGDTIAAWRSDLNRIFNILNIELAINTHTIVAGIRQDMMRARETTDGQNRALIDARFRNLAIIEAAGDIERGRSDDIVGEEPDMSPRAFRGGQGNTSSQIAGWKEEHVSPSSRPNIHTHRSDPFSSLFPQTRPILPGVIVVTSIKRGSNFELRGMKPIHLLEAHEPSEALRFLKCTTHADNTTIRSPRGGIINVALADPASLSVDVNTGYLVSNQNGSWVVSTLLGQTTYFSNSPIRQICITPFSHGWYRFTSVLSKVYNQNGLYLQSWREGITFGTSRFPSSGLMPDERPGRGNVAPIEGSVIRLGQDIPVYDGRDGFRLGSYWDRPYTGDVARGATVMLLFSVKKGTLPPGVNDTRGFPAAIKFGVYLNILGIVVLAEPVERSSERVFQEDPEAFGVSSIIEWP